MLYIYWSQIGKFEVNQFSNINCLRFTDREDEHDSETVLSELENIDDECDTHGITFVKIDNDEEVLEYGLDSIPSLVYFEKGVPSVYIGEYI